MDGRVVFVRPDGVDESDDPIGQRHEEGRCAGAAAEEAHTFEQLTVGDPAAREDDVLSRGEVFGHVDPIEVFDAELGHPAVLLVVERRQPSLDLAAEAAHRGRRQDAFRSTTGAEEGVDAGTAETDLKAFIAELARDKLIARG